MEKTEYSYVHNNKNERQRKEEYHSLKHRVCHPRQEIFGNQFNRFT